MRFANSVGQRNELVEETDYGSPGKDRNEARAGKRFHVN